MAAGKTSNLDSMPFTPVTYRMDPSYGVSVLWCDTFPNLTPSLAEELQQRVAARGMLFSPIFLRHHWIAGILRYDKLHGFTLTTHDSAPSACTHRDLIREMKDVWPQLTLRNGPCNRQERGSEDCGIRMTAVFFSILTNTDLPICDTLGSRLRQFLTTALRHEFRRKNLYNASWAYYRILHTRYFWKVAQPKTKGPHEHEKRDRKPHQPTQALMTLHKPPLSDWPTCKESRLSTR